MRDVVVVGYLRTAQSRSRPNAPERDVFHQLRADDLLAKLLPETLKRSSVAPEEVDDFLVGAAVGVNENFTYGGRYPIFLADLPETIPAKFVDQQCGSSMAGIHIGFMEIAMGFADTVLVGGMEHQTRNYGAPLRAKEGALSPNPRFFEDPAMAHWDFTTLSNMGYTAEKLYTQTDISKEEMDKWGTRAHNLAEKAQNEGFFDGEILPVEAEQADGSKMLVDKDQGVRAGASYEGVKGLKPAFKEDGVITDRKSTRLNSSHYS